MYKTYRDRAEFLLVYIREAHPDSILLTAKDGKKELTKISQTKTLEERNHNAQACTASLNLSMPTVVDKDDKKVSAQYAAWPDRMAVVGVDGKLAYYGTMGPRGFKPAEVEAWLKKNLSGKAKS